MHTVRYANFSLSQNFFIASIAFVQTLLTTGNFGKSDSLTAATQKTKENCTLIFRSVGILPRDFGWYANQSSQKTDHTRLCSQHDKQFGNKFDYANFLCVNFLPYPI
jgi:hypothetical protein